jgi:hypothetical protein
MGVFQQNPPFLTYLELDFTALQAGQTVASSTVGFYDLTAPPASITISKIACS